MSQSSDEAGAISLAIFYCCSMYANVSETLEAPGYWICGEKLVSKPGVRLGGRGTQSPPTADGKKTACDLCNL